MVVAARPMMMPPVGAGALRVSMPLQGPCLEMPPERPCLRKAHAVRREDDFRLVAPHVELADVSVKEKLHRLVDVLLTVAQGSTDAVIGILRLETRDLPDQ